MSEQRSTEEQPSAEERKLINDQNIAEDYGTIFDECL
jgi:hypothetical protein